MVLSWGSRTLWENICFNIKTYAFQSYLIPHQSLMSVSSQNQLFTMQPAQNVSNWQITDADFVSCCRKNDTYSWNYRLQDLSTKVTAVQTKHFHAGYFFQKILSGISSEYQTFLFVFFPFCMMGL